MNAATENLAPPERSISHRRKTSLAQYLILRQQLSSPPQPSKMNRTTQPRQGLAAGRGQSQQQQQQPPHQDAYGQGQDEEDQQGAGEDEEQHGQYGEQGDEQQDGQEGEEGQYGQEGEEGQDEDEQQDTPGDEEDGEEDAQQPGKGGMKGAKSKKGAAGTLAKKQGAHAVKPEHAHSRFSQDPHHHTMMANFHNIASAGLTPAHIESFVHIGTFALAHLAKQSGMTAGHEEA